MNILFTILLLSSSIYQYDSYRRHHSFTRFSSQSIHHQSQFYQLYTAQSINKLSNLKLNSSPSSKENFDFSFISDNWFAYGDCQILLPESKVPKSIIHFIGGFLVGTSPSVTYNDLLKTLANQGHMIVATSIPSLNTKHGETSIELLNQFTKCYHEKLTSIIGPEIKNVPVIGLSHSLGGKLTTLINSNKSLRRSILIENKLLAVPKKVGNIYLAFNNYDLLKNLEYFQRKTGEQVMDKIPDINDVINTITNSIPVEVQALLKSAFQNDNSNINTKTSDSNDNGSNTSNELSNLLNDSSSSSSSGYQSSDNTNTNTNTNTAFVSETVETLANGLQNILSFGSKIIETVNDSMNAVDIETSSFLDELEKILAEESSLNKESSSPLLNQINNNSVSQYFLSDNPSSSTQSQSSSPTGTAATTVTTSSSSSSTAASSSSNLKSKLNSTKTLITNNLKTLQNILNATAQVIKNETDATSSGQPFGSTFSSTFSNFDFTPTPSQTWLLISQGYNIQKNVIFNFIDDEIDQSYELEESLRKRGCDVVLLQVPGNHLTPNSDNMDAVSYVDSEQINESNKFIRYLCMSLNRLVTEHAQDLLDSTTVDSANLILPSSSSSSQ